MNLVVDIGNSSTKVGFFDHHELYRTEHQVDPDTLGTMLEDKKPDRVIVSSVGSDHRLFLDALTGYKPVVLSSALPLPFRIDYDTPETLGNDRLAAVAGAQTLFPESNCLVIDCGTCITYDLLSADNAYHGGSISLGMAMRFKALNTFTANLPLADYNENVSVTGKSTLECIQSGVMHGIIGEMDTFIDHYRHEFRDLKVIMCGGDTNFFENRVKARIFAAPDLVLRGLNRILNHNA